MLALLNWCLLCDRDQKPLFQPNNLITPQSMHASGITFHTRLSEDYFSVHKLDIPLKYATAINHCDGTDRSIIPEDV
jgi:hypothetical protein